MRARAAYLVLFLALVAAAFMTRIAFGWLFLPDLLTAAFVYFFFRMLFIRQHAWRIVLMTLMLTVAVELSQLYQSPWIEQLRATTAGRFILGHQFDIADLISYGLGVLAARFADSWFWGN